MSQKRASPKGLNRTQSFLTFFAATMVTALAAYTPWGQAILRYVWAYIALGLPALQGVINGRSSWRYYRQTQSSKCKLIIELICASLLVLAVFVALIDIKSLEHGVLGLILAAIATSLLTITGAIETIGAIRRKQYRCRCMMKFLLNTAVLIVYVLLLCWLVPLAILGMSVYK